MDFKEGACVGPKDARDSLGRSSGLPGTSGALQIGGWAREGREGLGAGLPQMVVHLSRGAESDAGWKPDPAFHLSSVRLLSHVRLSATP